MAVITEKAAFFSWLSVFQEVAADKIIDTTVTDADGRLFACYYDPLRSALRMKQLGLLSTSLCNETAANFRTTYNAYLVANSYNPAIPFLYTHGFALDWILNGNATSKAAIASLCANSAYLYASADQSKFSDIHYARELAFSLTAYLNNYRVGNGSLDARVATLKTAAFSLLTKVQNGTAAYTQFYIRPFMIALVTDALILYDELIGLTTGEKNAIEDCWEYIHTNLWRSGDTHPSLKFTSVNLATMDPNVPDTDEQAGLVAQNQDAANQDGPGSDVSLMIAPIYAWLYKEGYGDTWATRADDTFKHGFPHYIFDVAYAGEGDYYHSFGAFVGTQGLNGVNAKHVNQQSWMIAEFVEWQEAGPATEQTEVTSRYIIGGESGLIGGSVAAPAAYNPANYFTGGTQKVWIDWTDTTKVLDAGGASASNAEAIQTVNPAGGTPSLSQTTGASQPVVGTNLANGRQGAVFDGTKSFNVLNAGSVLNNATSVVCGVVGKLSGIGANGQFWNCVDNGWNTSRFKPFLSANNPALDGARTTVGATVTATGVNLADEAIFALLYIWDATNATATIWANRVVTDINADTFSTAGSIENADSNAGAPLTIGTSFDGALFDFFIHVNAIPNNTQILAWFDAVDTRFTIAAY